MRNGLHRLRTLAVTTAIAAHWHSSWSQVVPSQGEDALGEIVVTAEKRTSSAQKTAIAITAFDGETLQQNNVRSLADLSAIAPAVQIAGGIITIRGVSSQNTNEIGDPAISITQDGFYIQKPFGLAESVYDLERVEVLRGPQGTLYGRNATGGAINFITAKPTNSVEGYARVGYGNYDLLMTEGMFNTPLSDTVAIRGSFSTTSHNGYRTNSGAALPGDDADAKSGRLHLQWKPIERLSLLLTGQYTKIGGVGDTVQGYPLQFTSSGAVDPNFRPTLNRGGTPRSEPNPYVDNEIKTTQGNLTYDFDFASLVYQGGYRETHSISLSDLDGTTNASTYFHPDDNVHDSSHELRLVSRGDGAFKWQVGTYYFDENEHLYTLFQSYAVANSPLNRFIFSYHVTAKSKAAFGQSSYAIFDDMVLEAGIRYSNDNKGRTGFENLGRGNQLQDDASSSSKTTYHLGWNWSTTPRNFLYAKFDTGYKAGGFNSTPGFATVPYGPEEIIAFEAGSKNRFLSNNALQINLTAYHYDYKDQQISVSDQASGLNRILNAGKSEIYGVEAETILQASAHDRLDGSVIYTHGEYKDLCVNFNVSGMCTVSYTGNTPPQAPRWQLIGGYEHSFSVFGGSLTPRIQTNYESAKFLGIENFGYQYQGSHTRSDLFVTYADRDGKFTAQGFVRNLEDGKVLATAGASTLFNTYTFGLTPPRTYGVTLGYRF